MNWIKLVLAIIDAIRTILSLFKDLKAKEANFEPVHWLKRFTLAAEAYRKYPYDLAELKALSSLIGEKLELIKKDPQP